MASLFMRKNKPPEDEENAKTQRVAMSLTKQDRMKLTVLAVGIFVVLALAISLVTGARSTPLQHCRNILLSAQRYQCFAQLANTTYNVSVCGYIGQQASESSCVVGVAMRSGNVSTCYFNGTNSTGAEECATTVALATNNVSDCQTISDAGYSSSCAYALGEKNGFDSLAYCSAISNASKSADCKNIYYYRMALSKLNSTYCGLLPSSKNGTPIDALVANYSGNGAYNLTSLAGSATLATFNVTDQGLCYYKIAVAAANQSLCYHLNGTLNTLCRDFSSPENLASLSNSTVTPLTVAAACAATGLTGGLLNDCENYMFVSVATSRHSVAYCSYINNATIKSQCIAYATNSSS